MNEPIIKDKIVFDIIKRGYQIVATYLSSPIGKALIEVSKDGKMLQSFLISAYKVYNIAVHADDLVDCIEKDKVEDVDAREAARKLTIPEWKTEDDPPSKFGWYLVAYNNSILEGAFYNKDDNLWKHTYRRYTRLQYIEIPIFWEEDGS